MTANKSTTCCSRLILVLFFPVLVLAGTETVGTETETEIDDDRIIVMCDDGTPFMCPRNSDCRVSSTEGPQCVCWPGYSLRQAGKYTHCYACPEWQYRTESDENCKPCGCDPTDSTNCDKSTGQCTCSEKFVQSPDALSCNDVNECDTVGDEACPPHFTCINTHGGYDCMCPSGLCGELKFKLENDISESPPNMGRVDLYLNDVRGTICDVSFDNNAAGVVCRELGYKSGVAIRGAYFGEGEANDTIYVQRVTCSGEESTFLQCNFWIGPPTGCTHTNDAGVVCLNEENCFEDSTQYIGTTDVTASGRKCQRWKKLTPAVHNFTNANFPDRKMAAAGSFCRDPDGRGWPWCYYKSNNEYISEVCNIPPCSQLITLVGGPDDTVGQVQLHFGGIQAAVCGEVWDDGNASSVCDQSGHGSHTALALRSGEFGETESFDIYVHLVCPDNANTALDCKIVHTLECEAQAQLICNSEDAFSPELVDGFSDSVGRLELVLPNTDIRGTVCDSNWDNAAATLACKELGFSYGFPVGGSSFGSSDESTHIFVGSTDCNGTESSFLSCSTGYHEKCTHANDAGVICVNEDWSSDAVVSLEGGIPEVAANGAVVISFGEDIRATITSYNFDNQDAQVICSMLGKQQNTEYSFGLEVEPDVFAEVTSQFKLGPLECNGDESSLLECAVGVYPKKTTFLNNNAGLVCMTAENLLMTAWSLVDSAGIDKTSEGVGRLIFTTMGVELAVSDTDSNNRLASIVCRQLGFSSSIAFGGTIFGTSPYCLQNLACVGTESSFLECSFVEANITSNCNGFAGVRCHNGEYDLGLSAELMDGLEPNIGRVAVTLEGTSGTISDKSWTNEDMMAICRIIDAKYSSAISLWNVFGPDTSGRPILLADPECSEGQTIEECNSVAWGKTGINGHTYDVSGICLENDIIDYDFMPSLENTAGQETPMRKRRSSGNCGTVKVDFDNSIQGYICTPLIIDDTPQIARAVCNYFGQWGIPTVKSTYGYDSETPILFNKVICPDDSFDNCQFSFGADGKYCTNDYLLGAICDDETKLSDKNSYSLVNGMNEKSGRLLIDFGGETFTVCASSLSRSDANRICSLLGFPDNHAVVIGNAVFGESGSALPMKGFGCAETATTVTAECFSDVIVNGECEKEDNYEASIICDPDDETHVQVVLVDGRHERAGTVEISVNQQGSDPKVGTICSPKFDNAAANVVCRMLGYGSGIALFPADAWTQAGTESFNWFYDLTCTGFESSIFDCQFSTFAAYRKCEYFFASVECFFKPRPVFGQRELLFTLTGVDDRCGTATLPIEIPMCDQAGSEILVCDNGVMKLKPATQDGIAVLNMLKPLGFDIDLRQTGSVRLSVVDFISPDVEHSRWENSIIKNVKRLILRTTKIDMQFGIIVLATWKDVEAYTGEDKTGNTATFQVILVSDGEQTLAYYIYDEINWDIEMIGYDIYVGVHSTSPTSACNRPEDISFTPASLRVQNHVLTFGYPKMLFYDLTPSEPQETNYEIECLRWYNGNKHKLPYIVAQNEIMPECPCHWKFVYFDPWFDVKFEVSTANENVMCVTIIPASWFLPNGKTCCYDKRRGRFVKSKQYGGGYIEHHPEVNKNLHFLEDVKMSDYCCIESTKYCKLYRKLRPIGECYTKFPGRPARFFGDPHIITLDNRTYTFNGHGEYKLVVLETANYDFTLQGRTERFLNKDGDVTKATVFSAFAAADSQGASFMVQLNFNKTGMLVYSGNEDKTVRYEEQGDTFKYSNGSIYMFRDENTLSVTFTHKGIQVNVTLLLRMLKLSILLPDTFTGQTRGLMGNYDGDKTNEFICNNGTMLPNTATDRQIFEFGQSWSVEKSDSKFIYWNNRNNAFYTDKEFIPLFLDELDPAVVDNATDFCGQRRLGCIYDFISTRDPQVAENTEHIEEESEEILEILSNELPTIMGGNVMETTLNDVIEETITAIDDGKVTFSLSEDSSPGVQLVQNGTNRVIVKWTHVDTKPLIIGVVATDDKGIQSPIHSFEIVFCTRCSGHGVCNNSVFDHRSSDYFKYAKCQCSGFWQGDDCEVDEDRCLDDPCSAPLICVGHDPDTHETTGTGFHCEGSCHDGFRLVAESKCLDIDECIDDTICSHTCVNTVGSFHCLCDDGFQLNRRNKRQCEDIDECFEGRSGCHHICTNYEGGYNCSCHRGYNLHDVSQTCVHESDVCSKTGLTCANAHGCTQIDDDYKCFCNIGYILDKGGICRNVDECEQGLCMQACKDTEGSFECYCFDGFHFDSTGWNCVACEYPHYGRNCSKTCRCQYDSTCDHVKGCLCGTGWTGSVCDVDINECEKGNICGYSKACVNYNGSYACQCVRGYTEDQLTGECTVDVDECSNPELNGCGNNPCNNVDGGYYCTCEEGFQQYASDPTNCLDIDECAIGQSSCEHLCINGVGSYSCECYPGYDLADDRRSCIKMFEPCENTRHKCSHICRRNTSDTCSCRLGFTLSSDGQTCIDTDECADTDLNKCSHKCDNTEGHYSCKCNTGFELKQDRITCTECDRFHYGEECQKLCNCSATGTARCDKITGCVCKPGFSGSHCEADIDECQHITCPDVKMVCHNYAGFYECKCSVGYEVLEDVCSEIDECSNPTLNTCKQNCTNTDGSYDCSCFKGYRIDNSNGDCIDLDECADIQICDQHCENLPGGYRCGCDDGYILSVDDRRTCIDINECLFENELCIYPEVNCHNFPGSYDCFCDIGFSVATNSCVVCDDEHYGLDCNNNCSCVQENTRVCDKTTGLCTCKPGWIGDDCEIDIDECSLDAKLCSNNGQICVNTLSSYHCDCGPGYKNASRSADLVCEDIDECKEGTDNCEHFCTNVDGRFVCTCQEGYSINNNFCKACTGNAYGKNCSLTCDCHADGVLNTQKPCDGVHGRCICKEGWEGRHCEVDTDECATRMHKCSKYSNCLNRPGTYICNCRKFFKLEGDQITCSLEDDLIILQDITCRLKVKDSSAVCKHTFPLNKNGMQYELLAYYTSLSDNEVMDVFVSDFMHEGDAITVSYDIVLANRSSAIVLVSRAHMNLLTEGGISISQKLKLEAETIAIGNMKAVDNTALRDMVCALYTVAYGQCQNGFVCKIESMEPKCIYQPETNAKLSQYKAVIIASGFGVAILVLLIVAIVVYKVQKSGNDKVFKMKPSSDQKHSGKLSTLGMVSPTIMPPGWERKYANSRPSSCSSVCSTSTIGSFVSRDSRGASASSTSGKPRIKKRAVSPGPVSLADINEFFPSSSSN